MAERFTVGLGKMKGDFSGAILSASAIKRAAKGERGTT
jgi:hypothetical protein